MTNNIGIWLIGAYGSVGSTVITGHAILTRAPHLTNTSSGLVTALPDFSSLSLGNIGNLVLAGSDPSETDPLERFTDIADDASLCRAIQEDTKVRQGVDETRRRVTAGISTRGPTSIGEQVEKLTREIREFREREGIGTVVMVNLLPTEPHPPESPLLHRDDVLRKAIESDEREHLTESMLYAYAGIRAGCSLVNFTPSAGFLTPALRTLAADQGLCYAGNDGKTGETLVKCALAPLFRHRALNVLSWQGYNILGNPDGKSLTEPANKESKTATKDSVLPGILGYSPHSHVGIDFVPSLDDWKTAWDHIQFEGFMGVKMTMQFTWQGCDSILAAPLVLDLARLTEYAHRRGESGPLRHLGFFFKQPLSGGARDITTEFGDLLQYVQEHKE